MKRKAQCFLPEKRLQGFRPKCGLKWILEAAAAGGLSCEGPRWWQAHPPGQGKHPAERSLGCPLRRDLREEESVWIGKEGPPHGKRGRPSQASANFSPLFLQLHDFSSILKGFRACQAWHPLADPASPTLWMASTWSGFWPYAFAFARKPQEWNHAVCNFCSLVSFISTTPSRYSHLVVYE